MLIISLIAAAANFAAAKALQTHDPGPGHQHEHDHQHEHEHEHEHQHGSDRGGTTEDLNMRSAFLHMMSDGAVSVGVAIAGLIILLTKGWYWLDPAVSIVISVVIALHGWRLLRATADVLLESTPVGLNVDSLSAAIAAVVGVESVHDLHVWTLSSEVRAMSAHIVLDGHPTLEQAQVVGSRVKAAIGTPYRIAHATLELECEPCGPPEDFCVIA